MKYKYGLRVVCLESGRPMREFGIGISESSVPTQEDVLRWRNKRYQVICWFLLKDIDECVDKGMVFQDYFGEVL